MKPTYLCLAAIGALMIAGCDRSKEFEAEKALLMSRSDSLKYVIAERDGYFDEVVSSIHDVYNNLEIARSKEEQLLKQTGHGEGNMSLTSESAKADLVREIAAVDKTLTENREKIKRLQGKVKGFEKEFASLNAMIADLKKNLEERESTIASLQGNIAGLEQDVANKTQMVIIVTR
jgi:chromosome segregation ATPase